MADIVNGCGRCGSPIRSMYVPGIGPALCPGCLFAAVENGELQLGTSCENCGSDGTQYCESCYIDQYDNGQEDAGSRCSNCGNEEEAYCYDCARDEWELVSVDDPSICDSCGEETYETYCSECQYCSECEERIGGGAPMLCEKCARERFGKTDSGDAIVTDDGSTFEIDGMTIRWE